MVGWHHRLNGHEFEQTPGDGEGQGSLVCCSSWGLKELDTTVPEQQQQFYTELFEPPVIHLGLPGGSVVKNPPAKAGDAGSILGSGRSPREGNGTPLQYSCLGNPMDGGAWRATVQGVAKNRTRLSTHIHSNTQVVTPIPK